jgi:hypothetical protein
MWVIEKDETLARECGYEVWSLSSIIIVNCGVSPVH